MPPSNLWSRAEFRASWSRVGVWSKLRVGRLAQSRWTTQFHRIAMSKSFRFVIAGFLFGSLAIVSCRGGTETVVPPIVFTLTPASTLVPAQSPFPAFTVTPDPTFIPDTGWSQLHPGLERRVINLFDDEEQRIEYLYILRLEPEYYQFDVAYHPEPQTLEAWQAETGALVVVNGGYFRKENERYIPNGLTVVKGEVIGSSYDAFGGMLAITDNGPELRWLAQTPYNPTEPLRGALQSFPLLVKPGGEIGFPIDAEDNQQARRTVIGQDKGGRILFILAPMGYFTLHQLSAYLVASDLAFDIALNLDGGPSSGLVLSSPWEEISAYTLLPIVITVQGR